MGENKFLENGKKIYDTDGNVLHAHGGWILKHENYYYWYGEDRRSTYYVSCYRSKDLLNWEFRNHILTTESKTEKTRVWSEMNLTRWDEEKKREEKVNIERPKVLYNAQTGKFVLWAHYENGAHYRDARCCVASCDTPDGDFIYHGSFNPFGNMSRDCTVWQDEKYAYFLSASRENKDLHVYRLAADYLNVDKHVNTLWQSELREAPAVFKRGDKYYMLSSFCTGWHPNQGKFGIGDSLEGDWSVLELFGNEDTYRSQPAFVVERDGEYLYFGDRWCWCDNENIVLSAEGEEDKRLAAYCDSTYVILPIEFDENDKPFIRWRDTFEG